MSTVTLTLEDGRTVTLTLKGQQAPESNLAAAGAAGATRGMLGTLDIVPRGLAGGYNFLAENLGLPEVNLSPFTHLGQTAGLGTYQPQTRGEERMALGGEILGGSVLPGAGVVGASRAPARALFTEAMAAGGSAGGGVVGQEYFGPTGALVGTVLGGQMTPSLPRRVAQGAVRPAERERMLSTLGASERQGIPVTTGQAARGSYLEKASATFPGGIAPAGRFMEEQAERFGRRVEDLAGGLTTREASPSSAGLAIREGIDRWAENFRTRGAEKFQRMDEYISPSTQVFPGETIRVLDDMAKFDKFSDIVDPKMIRDLKERVGFGTYAFEELRSLRTRVGALLTDPSIIPDAPRGQLKRVYGAITKDLKKAAENTGPEALSAFEEANRFWREGLKQVDDFLDPIIRRKYPEQVFQAAMQGTHLGASRLEALKGSLDEEQWDTVVATVLRNMGKARASTQKLEGVAETASGFSPETFLTNLAKLDDRAREVLFAGERFNGLETDVNDLIEIASGIRGQRQAAFNPSGTTVGLLNAATVGGPLTALWTGGPLLAGKVTGTIAANYGLQRALQTPGVAQYVGRPTAFTPHALPQISRLGAVAGPDLLDIISQEPEL